jgi:hypothetical protein
MQERAVRMRRATALFVLVMLAVLAGCQPVEGTGRPGDTITAGDYQLTATNLENPAASPDRFTNPKTGYRFVKLEVTVTNRGQQHLPMAAAHFSLLDSGGVENPALRGVPTDTGLKETSLGPGQHLTVPMYFEMASNLSPSQLVFAPKVVGWNTRLVVQLQ